jgi:diguanylate cyclase (GGDEF)-like protein
MPNSTEDEAITFSKNDLEEVRRILLQLNATLESSQLYSPEHPRIREFNSELLTLLQNQIEESGDIIFRLLENRVVFYKIPLYEVSKAVSEFVQACLDRQIQSITFSRGLAVDELTQFIGTISMSPEELKNRGGIETELPSRGVSHIAVERLEDIQQAETKSSDAEKGEQTEAILDEALDYDDQLEAARAIIKTLQEELEMVKAQMESLWEKNRKLEEMSITDELTGLYNQRYFHKRLKQEVVRNRRQKHSLSLLFFDVDGLKTYNDTYGHLVGNDVLKAVAQSLFHRIRKSVDTGYRCGGDEFAVILPETRAEQATEVAKRINKSLQKAGFGNVNLSFGIAELGPEMDSETLFRYADDAMYMAKKGRGAESGVRKDKIYIYDR